MTVTEIFDFSSSAGFTNTKSSYTAFSLVSNELRYAMQASGLSTNCYWRTVADYYKVARVTDIYLRIKRDSGIYDAAGFENIGLLISDEVTDLTCAVGYHIGRGWHTMRTDTNVRGGGSILDGIETNITGYAGAEPLTYPDIGDWVVGQWDWIRVNRIGDDFKFYYAHNSVLRPADEDFTYFSVLDKTIVGFGEIVTIGVLGGDLRGSAPVTAKGFADDLSIKSDFSLTPEGLDFDTFSEYYVRVALNGGGNARFTVPDPFFNDIGTTILENQLKKAVIFKESVGGKILFKGEVGTLSISQHQAIYEAEEITRKTMFTPVNLNSNIYSLTMRYPRAGSILDRDAGWIVNGALASHVVSFEKTDTKVYATRPLSYNVRNAADSGAYTVDNILGDIGFLYFPHDDTIIDGLQGLVLVNDAKVPNDRWRANFIYNLYEKFENTIDKLEFFIEYSTCSRNHWSNTNSTNGQMYLRVWDYLNSTWLRFLSLPKDEAGSKEVASQVSPVFRSTPRSILFDIEEEMINDHFSSDWASGTSYSIGDRRVSPTGRLYTSQTNSNLGNDPDSDDGSNWILMIYDLINYNTTASASNEFSELELKIEFQAADHSFQAGSVSQPNGMWLWEKLVTATFVNDNEPEFSSTSINQVSDNTIIVLDNQTGGISLPIEDGLGVGDIVNVAYSAKALVEAAWTGSPINALATLDFDVTNSENFALSKDYTYETFFELLQDIGSLLNATWWYDYATDTVVVRSADLISSSGVTLTSDDFVGWNLGQWSIDYDATTERTNIIIIGDGVVVTDTFNEEHAFDFGNETEIIDDGSIQTQTQAQNLIDSLKPIHEWAAINLRCTLDYSNPTQNYTNLKVGNTVAVKLPTAADTSIADFSAIELMIISKETNVAEDTGYNEHVTFTLQLRRT